MDFQPSYKEFASIFKALSDETRLRVVDMLSCREMSAGDILSNYSINDETFNRAMDFLPELYKLKDKCVCQQIKYVKNPERQELGGADEFGN